jgi:hypothetical protein
VNGGCRSSSVCSFRHPAPTKYHLVRESVENDLIKVEFISRVEQLSDILTKLVGRVKFLKLLAKIGLINVVHNKA